MRCHARFVSHLGSSPNMRFVESSPTVPYASASHVHSSHCFCLCCSVCLCSNPSAPPLRAILRPHLLLFHHILIVCAFPWALAGTFVHPSDVFLLTLLCIFVVCHLP
ncbi:uncharacterized protein LAESUDRAFT_428485 [Laetiporus sulphureus 93-53]|uniref:Uncharacterized protein n=1 Tax=Laetiporus sulphureus 93-53 TaxID=1314785 RepID=A0A165GLP4_9APHY|nr:uncharacterized protein LAESUDRAFT_428485 [Laetiporus sulphureus 93-53]KZT10523.1 hypothetical protein LAESUDRAFT_428485 [Laetiporus sulphureus 93-53]